MNKKFLRVMGVILSVVMLFSCAVTASAASAKVTVRVEGLTECLDTDSQYIFDDKTLREVLTAADVDVVFATDSDAIVSVKGEEANANSKWQIAVNDVIVTSDIDEYIVNADSEIVIYNAAEDAVAVKYDDKDLAVSGVLLFLGVDKNGKEAPIENLKVIWDGENFKTDAKGQIYLGDKYLAKGEHEVSISKVNSNKVSTIIRYAADKTIEVAEVEADEKDELSSFDSIYTFFYDIFQGMIEVFMFYARAILGLFGVTI